MEQAGAVFLPATGCRYGSSVRSVGDNGYCWCSTPHSSNSGGAFSLNFFSSHVGMGGYYRYSGQGVRLVVPIKK